MAGSRNLEVLYIGVGPHIVAIRASSGEEVCRTVIERSTYCALHGVIRDDRLV